MNAKVADLNRVLTYAVWIIVIALAVNAVVGRRSETEVEAARGGTFARAVTVIPRTVTLTETRRTSEGSITVGSQELSAVRTDGSTVERFEFFRTNKLNQVSRRTIVFASGERIVMNELKEIKSTTKSDTYSPASTLRDPATACVKTFSGAPPRKDQVVLGENTVSGYKSTRLSLGEALLWFAPELGCAKLMRRRDFGAYINELKVTAIVRGEPDPKLFEVPTAFKEVPLSVQYGLKPSSPEAARFDEYYFGHQPRRKGK